MVRPPCRIVAPGVERLSQELAGQLKAVKVNTYEAPALQERFGIRGIPTLILMDGGRERNRVTGPMNVNALRQWVQQGAAGTLEVISRCSEDPRRPRSR